MVEAPAALPALAYGDVAVVFTDLDGTLFPGKYESDPKEKRPGLMKNMAVVSELEAQGVPVIPATGNNVSLAQVKLVDPATGDFLRDLRKTPGIYCNGALVKGQGGREIDVLALSLFIPRFIEQFLAKPLQLKVDPCVVGLCKERSVALKLPEMTEDATRAGTHFKSHMEIPESDWAWLGPAEFAAAKDEILSLVILFPAWEDTGQQAATEQSLIDFQGWLDSCDLLKFADATKKSSGSSDIAVCKHVHVPGIGPEVDISPLGVNKGSAIAKVLLDAAGNLGVGVKGSQQIAVFGDAGNDVELFGMKRDSSGESLEPLGLGYRPAIRVAMPWANDELLLRDSNVVATVDAVLRAVLDARGGAGKCS